MVIIVLVIIQRGTFRRGGGGFMQPWISKYEYEYVCNSDVPAELNRIEQAKVPVLLIAGTFRDTPLHLIKRGSVILPKYVQFNE